MRLPKSIIGRLVLLHLITLIAAAILVRYVLHYSFDNDVEKLQELAMRGQAELVARALEPSAGGKIELDLRPGVRDQYSAEYGRYRYSIIDDQGGVLFASAARQPLFSIDRSGRQIVYIKSPTPGGQDTIFGASLRVPVGNRVVWVQVAEDMSHRDVIVDDVVDQSFVQVTWATMPVFLLLLFADCVIFILAVRPLHRASELARDIGPSRIDVRLPTRSIPSEILPLIDAVNGALDRLESGFKKQQEFAADAAHELRTPLAVLRTRIDLLPPDDPARALLPDVAHMTRVLGQLLDAAEIETVLLGADERADLALVTAEVIESVVPLALSQGKSIEATGLEDTVPVRGNAEMIRRAIRNLVENALAHSPTGTSTEVAVRSDRTVTVRDQGPGIPEADRERIFERFWRRDRRRPGGVGLGLSIVKRIVDFHGATIRVRSAEPGGAEFAITFPDLDGAAPPKHDMRPVPAAR